MTKPHTPIPQLTEKQIQRFWSRINKSPGQGPKGDCWIWTGKHDKDGYGSFFAQYHCLRPHRLSYFLATGNDPGPLLTCHKCDNPPCVNPAHLFLGTTLDNARDMITKGRKNIVRGPRHISQTHPERLSRGEKHGSAKLTEDMVRAIRSNRNCGLPQWAIAKQYGVSQSTICDILSRKYWTHID